MPGSVLSAEKKKKKNVNKAPLVSCRRGVSASTSLFISSAAGVRECFAHESVFWVLQMDSPQTVHPRLRHALFLPVNAHKALGTVHKKFIGAQSTSSELNAECGVCCFPASYTKSCHPLLPRLSEQKIGARGKAGNLFVRFINGGV